MLVFELLSPDGSTQQCKLPERDLSIGRDAANDVVLSGPDVSRFHAAIIMVEPGKYVLRDLGSRNGTFVNDAKRFRHVLEPGDRARLGDSLLVFVGQSGRGCESTSGLVTLSRKRARCGTADATVTRSAERSQLLRETRDLPEATLVGVLQAAREMASMASVTMMVTRLLECVITTLGAQRGCALLWEGEALVCVVAKPEKYAEDLAAATCCESIYAAIDQRAPVLPDAQGPAGAGLLCLPLVSPANAAGALVIEGAFASPVAGLDVAVALCDLCATNSRSHASSIGLSRSTHSCVKRCRRSIASSARHPCSRTRLPASARLPSRIMLS